MRNIFDFLKSTFAKLGQDEVQGSKPSNARQFVPEKRLREVDAMVIAMLNSNGHEDTCYCVCDPDLEDSPIIFSSDGFCAFTGYDRSEIEGHNCRFLQGKDTKESDIEAIRQAIRNEEEKSVNLLNYRKDGSTFINEFFISPLYTYKDGKKTLAYFIGVQCPVATLGPGQAPQNVGWVYKNGSKTDIEGDAPYRSGKEAVKKISSRNELSELAS